MLQPSSILSVPGRLVDAAWLAGHIGATDLVVQRITAGAAETLAIGTDYSVTGGETDAGGTLVRTAATNGATLRIRRS